MKREGLILQTKPVSASLSSTQCYIGWPLHTPGIDVNPKL